jgi:rhamnose utilization protein RhaD (predicted bifunctional aldolase and dehydrogenase)
VKVGSDPDLVQASGGNTSYKSGHKIWVKGSGKRLVDAHSDEIFACVNFESLTEAELLDCQDFSPLATNSIIPSIEANFHILLKKNFVTHLHSLGSIAIGILAGNDHVNSIGDDIRIVPYVRPGVDLANAIRRIEDYSEVTLVLQNHGVIFSGQSCIEIERKIEEFELRIQQHFAELTNSDGSPGWIDILTAGVLTPDEAVFLGPKPFVKSENPIDDSIGINSMGELLFPDGFSSDRTDLAKFYVRVAKLIEGKTQVSYLPKKEVNELLGWDKEQVRITMAK